jgi:hypothetical protein
LSIGCAAARAVPELAPDTRGVRSGHHTVCLPPYWGGLLAGVSTDSEVTRLLGDGHLDEKYNVAGARFYTDSSRSTTLKVEFGTDRIVASAELREGVDPGLSADIVDEMVSKWVRPSAGVGVWWNIHLGDSEAAVRKNLREPTTIDREGEETVWWYESVCACELPAGLSFRFLGGRLVAFSVWAAMG